MLKYTIRQTVKYGIVLFVGELYQYGSGSTRLIASVQSYSEAGAVSQLWVLKYRLERSQT